MSDTFPNRRRADEINRAAVVHPQEDDWSRPSINLAGVQVYAYLDPETQTLRVGIDLDEAVPEIARPDGTVPLCVTCQGWELIFEG